MSRRSSKPTIIDPAAHRPPWNVHVLIRGDAIPMREPGAFNGLDAGETPRGLVNLGKRFARWAHRRLFGQDALSRLIDETLVIFEAHYHPLIKRLTVEEVTRIAQTYVGAQRAYYLEWQSSVMSRMGEERGFDPHAVEVTPENIDEAFAGLPGFSRRPGRPGEASS